MDMIGVKRNSEAKAREPLSMFPLVALLGACQVGKLEISCPQESILTSKTQIISI
jgi:hypothetical protein